MKSIVVKNIIADERDNRLKSVNQQCRERHFFTI